MDGTPASAATSPSGLWTRVRTAALLIGGLSATLAVDQTLLTSAVFLGVLALAALEWAGLIGWQVRARRVLYGLLIAAGGAATLGLARPGQVGLLSCAAVFWAGMLVLMWRIQLGSTSAPRRQAFWAVAGGLCFLPAYLGLLLLAQRDPWQLCVLFILVWAADSAAYFGGRAFGKARLASRISPGKTWVGAGAGVAAPLALSVLLQGLPLREPFAPLAALAGGLAVGVAAITGDLFESLAKRRAGAKDSGSLLPGHGGVLDRIDSLLAAAPVYALFHLFWATPS